MVRNGEWVTITASGKTVAVTASGKTLGNLPGISEKHRLSALEKALETWEALPDADKKPTQLALGTPDPERPLYQPPSDALIVRVFNRQFEWQDKGKLRYTVEEDYAEGEGKRGWARFRESAQDTMWIPKNEWTAFIPKEPQEGQSFSPPATFTLRLFKYHLDPERGLGEGVTFRGAKLEDGELTLTVEKVTPAIVQLRLDGVARLSQGRPDDKQTGYDTALLGHSTCDRKKGTITQFDMVVLGDVLNTPRRVRPGWHPLGIAFELVTEPTNAELVVPRGGRDNAERYLTMTR